MNHQHTIAISGASGLIGSRLTKHFQSKKWEVIPIGRRDFAGSAEALVQKLEPADIVINLAGAPIIKRWTKKHKQEIYNSRILTTRKLVRAIEVSVKKPLILLSVSGVNIYNDKGVHDEHSRQLANDFLSEVCVDWEAEAEKASSFTRTVITRLGVVLAREGGALKTMLFPFKLGIGGKIASGKQSFSWIHIDDVVSAMEFLILNSHTKGVYNLVAPGMINNREFTVAFGKALKRPTWFTVPAFALRLLYGDAAATLTGGQKVVPLRLEKAGFKHQFPEIEAALEDLI